MRKDLKRANGSGSVYKLSGRRAKPYIAIITSICEANEEKKYSQKRVPIGYYRTKDEALVALSEYVNDPYDLRYRRYTFSDLYNEWSQIHYKEIVPSAVRTWKSAYNYFGPIHSMIFTDIRAIDIEKCISNADVHSSTKKRMKSLCNMLYKYAIKNDIAKINYAQICDNIKSDPPVFTRKPFSEEELRLLWNNIDMPYVDMILIGIYSGWRPQELTSIEVENVNLQEGYITGGMKTESGKNRIVPIHSRILSLIERRMLYATEHGYRYLFDQSEKHINYDIYRNHFNNVMSCLKMEHRPHDTRHTFITLAKESGVDEYILKTIVGHSTNDITERVYTHRRIESLKIEIEKIS